MLLSREQHRVALCINSFPTSPGGVVAPIVDVGQGTAAADYEGKDVRGAVVVGDAGTGRLWQMAVVQRGAIGVVSTALESYVRPGPPGSAEDREPRGEWEVLQWGSVPYDETRRAFGFKATPRAAARIRARLTEGPARVKVEIASSFSPGPVRSLVAEIPGTVKPEERVLLVAHIQEPGANDNASGCATLVELARADSPGHSREAHPGAGPDAHLHLGRRNPREPAVDRGPSGRGEAGPLHVLARHDGRERGAHRQARSSSRRRPIPTAAWPRPSDPHTEWGSSPVKAESLKGTLLNDVFLAVCQRPPWTVRDQSLRRRERPLGVPCGRRAIGAGVALSRSVLPFKPRPAGHDRPGRDEARRRRASRPRRCCWRAPRHATRQTSSGCSRALHRRVSRSSAARAPAWCRRRRTGRRPRRPRPPWWQRGARGTERRCARCSTCRPAVRIPTSGLPSSEPSQRLAKL